MPDAANAADTRPPAVAGTFYGRDAEDLRRAVRAYVDGGAPGDVVPRAVIVPHAGYAYSGPVAGSGYRALARIERPVRRVYLLGPAHRVYTRGVAAPTHRWFATPLGRVAVDREVIDEILRQYDFVHEFDDTHAHEHSLEVHLPFLQTVIGEFTLVPLVVGEIHPRRLAPLLDAMLDDDEAVVVVSSDLSHYHAYDEARAIDAGTIACMERLDWQAMRPERACGFLPVSALLLSAAERGYQVQAVDVRNSGDTAGPRDRVVGYASLLVHEHRDRFGARERGRLLALARAAIEHGIDGRPFAVDSSRWPAHCAAPAAAFVTLKAAGALRGCIGSLEPTGSLIDDVATNAVRAALHDPRFAPLSRAELDSVNISISVLGRPSSMHVTSEDDLLSRLRPGEDGLILTCGNKRATFLPSVWETLRTPQAFLAGLRRKAGLPDGFWSDEIGFQRYTTETFAEP